MRPFVLLLTCVTGFSGLVYEVAWQRALATLLGSHSEATAAVLALFLGGLSVGYSLFGRTTRNLVAAAGAQRRPPRVLFAYGLVEISIGVWALAFPLLFQLAQAVSVWIPLGAGVAGFAFDVLLSAILIGPPSVMMGATIPMLTQALTRDVEDATRFHALVYGMNTIGAFTGALAAGFWLVSALGLVKVIWLMGAINIAAGGLLAAAGRRGDREASAAPKQEPAARIEKLWLYAATAMLTGFAMMAVQTVLIRIGGLSLGSSHFTFAMVVAVFVLCIAVGSLGVSLLQSIRPAMAVANQWALAFLLILLYWKLPESPYWSHVLRSVFRDSPDGMYPYFVLTFLVILAAISLPIAMSGAVLPLLFHQLRREAGELGEVAGRLYSWNTIGSLLGALLGGYLLLFWLDLHAVYRLAVAALVVAAALLSAAALRWGWLPPLALGMVVIAGLASLDPWPVEYLASGLFREKQPLPGVGQGAEAVIAGRMKAKQLAYPFYDDDPIASIAVSSYRTAKGGQSLAILTNGKPDSSLADDYPTTALIGLLPALMAEQVERVFVVGYGTGVTVGELAALDSVQEVVVAEISRGVLKAAPLFESGNLSALASPKTKIIRADAYRALLRSEGSYDVIASEPSNPWVTGVEMLYSREFLEAARSRLRPGGVYLQWFHSYETDADTIALVLRTYSSVFDQVAVWFSVGSDLLLIGFAGETGPELLPRIVARASEQDYAAGLRRAGVSGVPALLAHELYPRGVVGTLALDGPVHTLLHPILSDRAARAFFAGEPSVLPASFALKSTRAGRRSSLLQGYADALGRPLDDSERSEIAEVLCRERGRECLTALAEWLQHDPQSPALREAITMARQQRDFRGVLDEQLLWLLSSLFDADSNLSPSTNAQQAARQATDLYKQFYFHGAPFDIERLERLWARCLADPDLTAGCRRDLERVKRDIGELHLSTPSRGLPPG